MEIGFVEIVAKNMVALLMATFAQCTSVAVTGASEGASRLHSHVTLAIPLCH